jgi:uncharacterized protein YecE (DUF72 family)
MKRCTPGRIFIGSTGWSIPRAAAHQFDGAGTHLQRYAAMLTAAEINSSFHRPHKPETYGKWASLTPRQFRFAVKVPGIITHDQRLLRIKAALERFLEESAGLKSKRGPLLLQFPPSVAFERRRGRRLLDLRRANSL